jgi:hypothetical protein
MDNDMDSDGEEEQEWPMLVDPDDFTQISDEKRKLREMMESPGFDPNKAMNEAANENEWWVVDKLLEHPGANPPLKYPNPDIIGRSDEYLNILNCMLKNELLDFEGQMRVFLSACKWSATGIIDRLLQFPLVHLFLRRGFIDACTHNSPVVVNHLLKLPIQLDRDSWYCLRLAFEHRNWSICTRLLQDDRIPKKEMLGRWSKDEKECGAKLKKMLQRSRLRMMIMYSKGFGRSSGIPKELVHLISSYTEPYHIKELQEFALFIEKIETTRDVVPFNQQRGSPGI